MLAYAMNLAPFKDVFWSTSDQPDHGYDPTASEPYTELQSAIATLSTGPVGPGDCIGCMNKEVIMR